MTVLAKLRRKSRLVAIILAAVAASVAGAPFAASAMVPATPSATSSTTSSEHCAALLQDNVAQNDLSHEAGASHSPTHLHSSDGESPVTDCCDTDCHCPSIASGHALLPATTELTDTSAVTPEYPPAPILEGHRPDELLRPPI